MDHIAKANLQQIATCCRISATMLTLADQELEGPKWQAIRAANVGQANLLRAAADMAEQIMRGA